MTGIVFQTLIFPGALFLLTGAVLAGFADRKITAAMESRVGPPTLQTLYDFIKLSAKQAPSAEPGKNRLSIIIPLASFVAALAGSFLVWRAVFRPASGFKGDFFAVSALLAAASIGRMTGVYAATRGVVFRPVNFSLTAELPFFIASGVPFLQSGAQFRLGGLASHQSMYGLSALSASGAVAFAVVFLTAFAKLRFPPFDAAETGLELFTGTSERHSGIGLALQLATPRILLFTLPALLCQLFWGGMSFHGTGIFESILKYGLLLAAFPFIRNLNPGMTLSAAFKWHLGPMTAGAAVAVLLSILRW